MCLPDMHQFVSDLAWYTYQILDIVWHLTMFYFAWMMLVQIENERRKR